MNSICINNQQLQVKEWNGERVVTFKDIDMVHGRPYGTAKRNFNTNQNYFIEGEDYYLATAENAKSTKFVLLEIPKRGLVLLTESGYLMLVKSFTDDLAWAVQRQLVKSYFRVKEEKSLALSSVRRLTYHGEPVATISDIARLVGASRDAVYWTVVRCDAPRKVLNKSELDAMRNENPNQIAPCPNAMTVLNENGVEVVLRERGVAEEEKARILSTLFPTRVAKKVDRNDFILYMHIHNAMEIGNFLNYHALPTTVREYLTQAVNTLLQEAGFNFPVDSSCDPHTFEGQQKQLIYSGAHKVMVTGRAPTRENIERLRKKIPKLFELSTIHYDTVTLD